MNPIIVALFGEIKGYLHSFLVDHLGQTEINPKTVAAVKTLCDEGLQEEVIACLNVVKHKLTLDDYYHVKTSFRHLEHVGYQFNYDFFRMD